MLAANAPPELIERLESNSDASKITGCEVWPENWEAFELFIALGTQWRVAGLGQYIGISYPSMESVLNIFGIDSARRAALFADLRIMERAALDYFNERKN